MAYSIIKLLELTTITVADLVGSRPIFCPIRNMFWPKSTLYNTVCADLINKNILKFAKMFLTMFAKINLNSTEIKLYAKTTGTHHRIWILCQPITSVSDPYLFPGQNLNTDPYVKLIIFLTKKREFVLL